MFGDVEGVMESSSGLTMLVPTLGVQPETGYGIVIGWSVVAKEGLRDDRVEEVDVVEAIREIFFFVLF